jgi:hypothetical protein
MQKTPSPISEPPGGKIFQVSDFSFGLSGTSINLPNFSFQSHVEVGYFFWRNIHISNPVSPNWCTIQTLKTVNTQSVPVSVTTPEKEIFIYFSFEN